MHRKKGVKTTARACAEACAGIASMFIYGTNAYGKNLCSWGGCPCYCEHGTRSYCKQKPHRGFNLYMTHSVDKKPKLVAKKMECAGTAKQEIFTGYHDLSSCQKSCATKTDMFILGTNEFGLKQCRGDGKCRCYCEVRTKTRCVKHKKHNGYNLYSVRG